MTEKLEKTKQVWLVWTSCQEKASVKRKCQHDLVCIHCVSHELFIPKYSGVKCEAICPAAKAWLKLGHAWDSDPNTAANPQMNG